MPRRVLSPAGLDKGRGPVRYFRRSRLRSSRGHVRVDHVSPRAQWAVWAALAVALVVVVILVITQVIRPSLDQEDASSQNRTWLEFAWTTAPVNQDAVIQLARRLDDNDINRVYLEAAAWRTDGTLLDGEYAADFVRALREASPKIEVLLWLRMSGEEIAQPNRQMAAVDLAQKAVRQWDFDGVQLNGRAVIDGNEAYIQLVRDLRSAVGSGALLSVTVPPDRIPTDPDVPIGSAAEAELTWDVNYKQRVGLLMVDEIVVMAHASGLLDTAQYETWVAYQVESYIEAMTELDRAPEIIIALPTYDVAPDHDPAVEDVSAAARGVKAGIKQAGKHGDMVKGVGLYEYKSTDSLEWAHYAEVWLGRKKS